MRKLVSILEAVTILYLISVIYRVQVTPVLSNFPVDKLEKISESEPKLNLVLFFSKKTCWPCLQPVVNFLNEPPEYVQVLGIVRNEDMKFLDDIRNTTGARFPIKGFKRWKKYRPNYAPTLYGIGPDGKIYFIIACTGLEESYLRSYVDEFRYKVDYLFH